MAPRAKPAEPETQPKPPAEEVQLLDDNEQLPKPTNVIEALARVEREIKGIRKLTPAQRARMTGIESGEKGVNFAYRGIDQIASLAQPLFGEYGIVMVPDVLDLGVEKIVKGREATMDNTPWTRTTVKVRFDIYGPGGVEDMISSTVVGLGDDNSDKGINKAMTAAFKNVLLRVLCIGDPQDDTDQYQRQPHEYDDEPQGPPPADPVKDLWTRIIARGGTPWADEMKQIADELGTKLTEKNLASHKGFFDRIKSLLDAADVADKQDADAEAPQDVDLLDAGADGTGTDGTHS